LGAGFPFLSVQTCALRRARPIALTEAHYHTNQGSLVISFRSETRTRSRQRLYFPLAFEVRHLCGSQLLFFSAGQDATEDPQQ